MRRESLGMAMSDSIREFILRYGEWAFTSPFHGVISFLIVTATVVVAVALGSKVLWPLFRLVTAPLWVPIRRRRRIAQIQRAVLDPTGMAAVEVLNQLSVYWGKATVDVEAAEEHGEIWVEGKDLPVRYPSRSYKLRVPRGLAGEVKALMHSLGREEGWVFRNSRKGGKTELLNSNVGYRL